MRKLITIFITTIGLIFVSNTSLAANENGVDQALLGLNGVITAPLDPVVGLIEGDDRFRTLPLLSPVINRVVGLTTGSWQAVKRTSLGTADILLSVFPPTALSPKPRFAVFVDENTLLPEKPEGF